MYNKESLTATEFINHEEILETLEYAKANKNNRELIDSLIERAADCKGLTHREAAVLLECDLEDENEKMYSLAKEIKQKFYGNRIVCSLRFICQITVSTGVSTVLITARISISGEKN